MIGKEILNYTIVSVIGKGGMGSVYLAEHKYIKLQKAAIKVINGGMVNSFTRKRLAEEAEHLARLNNNNIVRFLNYHIDESDSVYLIMEYAEGVTLDKYINEISGLIVEDRIYSFFSPILDAVGYAHKNDVIHRDIKPSNIIITKEESVKILDFGIARIMDKEGGNDLEDKMIMGTPAYMSPEQVKGEPLDARSDIYSLGVLLYQMLTGNAPYDTTTLSEYDINKKVVEEALPSMSTFYKYISDKLQKIVDKATAKNPKDRYQTCAEFKKALHNAIYPPKIPKWVKTVTAACILLLVGSGIYMWDYNRTKVYYYKDYVEQWGIPQGINELDSKSKRMSYRMYCFEYCQRKLQRVSHVNSVGIVIADYESERSERPLDMLFTYAPDGKVSKVKVKNEYGKVMYIKSYNDKLNTLIFQYDDAYGTEKITSSQTIGDVNSLTNTEGAKGRISRWLLEYDENGYVSTISYAAFQNVLVGDANNIYGRKYTRDSKGRIIEEVYLGKDGKTKTTNWGLGMKRFFYDERDNFVRSEYYTADGKPALDQVDGTNVMIKEYDSYGNVIAEYYQDHDGNMMLPKKHLIAGNLSLYDNKGFLVQVTALGVDKQPCYTQSGYAIQKVENNEFGHIIKQSFFDIDNNPCYSTGGYAYYEQVTNKLGQTLSIWYYDIEGKLIENTDGRAGANAEYDDFGNLIKIVNYGIDKKPIENSDGVYGYEWEFNELGLLTKTKNLGKDLNYSTDKYGAIIIAREYDKAGNAIREHNEAPDGKLLLKNTQYSAKISKYNENGNLIEESFLNDKNEPCKGPNGFAKLKFEYDANGFLSSIKYYDLSNSLCLYNGVAGELYTIDERGNCIKEIPIGLDGNQSTNGYEIRRTFDKNDNLLTIAYYDKGVPIKNGYHKIEYTYNSRNQKISTKYYDVHGKLVAKDDDKYAIERYEYNDQGYIIKTDYFGTNEQPIECKDGWSSVANIRNSMGQAVKNIYYGTNGLPANTSKCIPIVEYQFDKWNNIIYFATKDGNGKFYQAKNYEFSIYRRSFDARGNVIASSYYDENDRPIINKKEGYHSMKSEYDKQGNKRSIAYFGVKGEAIKSTTLKYHKVVYEYDKRNNYISCEFFNELGKEILVDGYFKMLNSYNEENQLVEQKYYGIDGKPINATYGFHRVVYSYKKNGQNDRLKTYTVSGILTNTYTWDGYDWQQVRNWKDILSDLSNLLPYDYGSDYDNLVLRSAVVVDDNNCKLTFTVPHSEYSISAEELKSYIEWVDASAQMVADEPELRSSKVKVTIVLYDLVYRELYVNTL